MCTHQPPCPGALSEDRAAARMRVAHHEQGWSLLCNGVIRFDDEGLLLPGGAAVARPSPWAPAQPRTGRAVLLRSVQTGAGALRPVA